MKRNRKHLLKRFTLSKQRKLNVAFAIVILITILLNIRIVSIQARKGDEYTKQVLSQQSFDSMTIPFRRGDIKDRNGTLLATSQKVYNLILDCKLLNEQEKSADEVVRELCKCFPDLEEANLRQILIEKPDSRYTVLLKKLSAEAIKDFITWQDENTKNTAVNGVWFEDEYQRNYLQGSLACHILGFTNSGNVGSWGIEQYYNDTLNGTNGREYGYLNTDTEYEKVVKPARDGNNIISTIDANIQRIVEEKILAFNESHRNEAKDGAGSKSTAVIIQDPNTGEILAEACYPVFDLNNPRSLEIPGIALSEDVEMSEESKVEALNGIWRNFCLSDTFEPGSTMKPFTVAMGLETGRLSGNESYVCSGSLNIGGHDIHCVNKSGHGTETISDAIVNSCNVALMEMSKTIGIDIFTKYQGIFGFGKKTNIDLPAEANAANLMYTKDTMTPVDLATNAFGQNFNVTMTQMMSGFCSLINGGNYYEPHVVKKVIDENGATVKTIEPKLLRQTVSKETSDIVKGYLNRTVMEGTANTALPDGYTMGGKTGTAEKHPRKEGRYVLSFIGYAPADNPQVTIYVVIDEPNVADQAHSSFATGLAKDILTEVFPYMNIFPAQGTEDNSGGVPPANQNTQVGERVYSENGGEISSIFED